MEPDRADLLTDDWLQRHVTVEPPSPDATAAVRSALCLVWAVRGSAGVREGARCRRIPLMPQGTVVEVSERRDPGAIVRHWWFEVEEDPLVFRTTGEDEPERFARALAGALGWPVQ